LIAKKFDIGFLKNFAEVKNLIIFAAA